MTIENTAFQAALEARKKMAEEEEAKKNNTGGSYGDYEQTKYFGLEDKKEKVFRILGLPVEVRKENWHSKIVLQSSIAKEDRKGYFKINWPSKIKDGKHVIDPDFVLSKLYNKVMESKWTNYTEADLGGEAEVKAKDGKFVNKKGYNGYYKRLYEDTKIYKIINENYKEDEMYPKKFYPSVRVLMPVIDRHDNWCVANKHSKILSGKIAVSKKANDKGEFNEYFDTGIPYGCYVRIMDHMGSLGHWNTDFVAIKDSVAKDYTIWDLSDKKYLTDPNTFLIGKETPLTAEEMAYTHYDLDQVFKVSSANKIKKNFLSRFKLCDAELGTDLEAELLLLCKFEDEEKAKLDAERKKEEAPETKSEVKETPEVKTEVKAEEPPVSRRASTTTESVFDLCVKNFPKFKELSEAEQKVLASRISGFEGVIPTYIDKADSGLLCRNEQCYYPDTTKATGYPEGISQCPVCGTK